MGSAEYNSARRIQSCPTRSFQLEALCEAEAGKAGVECRRELGEGAFAQAQALQGRAQAQSGGDVFTGIGPVLSQIEKRGELGLRAFGLMVKSDRFDKVFGKVPDFERSRAGFCVAETGEHAFDEK